MMTALNSTKYRELLAQLDKDLENKDITLQDFEDLYHLQQDLLKVVLQMIREQRTEDVDS